MAKKILIYQLLFCLLSIFSCNGKYLYRFSSRNFVLRFPYENYVEKTYGEFYHDFKTKGDKKRIEIICNLYHPGIIDIQGTQMQIGNGYKIKTFFKSQHYIHLWPDTISCSECNCPEYDTAKIARFELLKNNNIIRTYN